MGLLLKGGGESVDEFAEADALVGCEPVELGSGFGRYGKGEAFASYAADCFAAGTGSCSTASGFAWFFLCCFHFLCVFVIILFAKVFVLKFLLIFASLKNL